MELHSDRIQIGELSSRKHPGVVSRKVQFCPAMLRPCEESMSNERLTASSSSIPETGGPSGADHNGDGEALHFHSIYYLSSCLAASSVKMRDTGAVIDCKKRGWGDEGICWSGFVPSRGSL